jgi:hypothetical protein
VVQITKFNGCAHEALTLLSEINIGARAAGDPAYCSAEYNSWLEQIERRMCSIRQELQQQRSLSDLEHKSESVAVQELFVLATLVYFERKSKQLIGASSKTDQCLEDGFEILAKLESCNKPFPLFVFGREAQVDSRRLLVLQVIDKTIKKSTVSNLSTLKSLLLTLWVQDDLNVRENGDQHRNGCWIMQTRNFAQCLL